MKPARTFATLALTGMTAILPLAIAMPSLANQTATTAAQAAAPAKDAVASTTAQSADKDLITTVDDAFKSMREVRAARLALFDGNTDMAGQMVASAVTDMTAAQAAEKDYGIASKTGKADATYIPIDSSIALGEGFTVTPQNQDKVKAANDKMAQGDAKGAAETLKEADIDVSVSVALVPATESLDHLNAASTFIKDGKYYEANLALKAVEDGVVIDNWSMNDLPKQAAAKS